MASPLKNPVFDISYKNDDSALAATTKSATDANGHATGLSNGNNTAKAVDETKSVAATIKETEADEPLLQENPQRFVLFPIKYHEVRDGSFLSKTPCGFANLSTTVYPH